MQRGCAHHAASDDFWAVCLGNNHKLIGHVYLSGKEQFGWELGYVFNYAYQRNGYATEAVRALIDMVFADKDARRIYANCNPDNVPSWKLLERVGFRPEGLLRSNVYFNCNANGTPLWQDTFLYGLLKEEWSQKI